MDFITCPKCGGHKFNTNGNCMDCNYSPTYKSFSGTYTSESPVTQGWQCPICKRVMAPFMSYCSWCYHNPNVPIITSDNFHSGCYTCSPNPNITLT